ncbi:MAG: hypothetical protein J6Y93_00470, partial [Treponema sp.]|nr:hypothetical protein [Treponema sp.]
DNDELKIVYQDHMVFYGIDFPEDGLWNVICEDADEETYCLEAFMTEAVPSVSLNDDYGTFSV